jgi:hypothetical protein
MVVWVREAKFLGADPSIEGYFEIFPMAPAFLFSFDSQTWLAIDDYWVNPERGCRPHLPP